jgi:hypothetical protein
MRFKGELFDDESVQKILEPVLNLFLKYVKYPRTWHLPWSPGKTKDDRVIPNTKHFEGQQVVVTLKMDGENTSMYNDYMHARSLDSKSDETRHWIKNYHAKISWQIPEGWRFCTENLCIKHSIKYNDLDHYCMLFSVWDENNNCLPWKDTQEWAALLDMTMVPTLYEGVYDEKLIKNLFSTTLGENEMEGYVVRMASGFKYKDFSRNVAKFVREGHVTTSHHWKRQILEYNGLKNA